MGIVIGRRDVGDQRVMAVRADPGIVGTIGSIADIDDDLFPSEHSAVQHAVAKRRKEFAAGRALAREALVDLGYSRIPILSGSRREPLWPPDLIGSIAHSDQLAMAVVARRGPSHWGIGVDVELMGRLNADLYEAVLTGRERASVSAPANDPTSIFSAKEAVYKAVNPITGNMLDFTEVEISFDQPSLSFVAKYVGDQPSNKIIDGGTGSFAMLGDHIVCLFVISQRTERSD